MTIRYVSLLDGSNFSPQQPRITGAIRISSICRFLLDDLDAVRETSARIPIAIGNGRRACDARGTANAAGMRKVESHVPMSRSTFPLTNLLVAAVGAALLAFTIQQVGWNAAVSGVVSVGWAFAAVVGLAALRVVVRARAWVMCAQAVDDGEGTLRFVDAFTAMLSADAPMAARS